MLYVYTAAVGRTVSINKFERIRLIATAPKKKRIKARVAHIKTCRRRGGNGATNMRPMIISIVLLLLGCTNYYLVNQNKYSSVEKINKGLLDSTKVDTTKWSVAFANFIKESNPINRNFDEINETVQKNSKSILISCNAYANKLGFSMIDTVWFGISSDGVLMISSLNSKSITDTAILNSIKKDLATVHFDSSKEGKYHCRFSALIVSNGTSQEIKVNSNILFGKVGRSKSSIMQTVMKYLRNMRYAYNRRLSTTPGIRGKLTVKFGINQYGQVFYVHKVSSTLSDEILDSALVQQIQHWKFDPILTDKDVTEVVYPFVFSQ